MRVRSPAGCASATARATPASVARKLSSLRLIHPPTLSRSGRQQAQPQRQRPPPRVARGARCQPTAGQPVHGRKSARRPTPSSAWPSCCTTHRCRTRRPTALPWTRPRRTEPLRRQTHSLRRTGPRHPTCWWRKTILSIRRSRSSICAHWAVASQSPATAPRHWQCSAWGGSISCSWTARCPSWTATRQLGQCAQLNASAAGRERLSSP